ncbi:MAG: hypothetical protein BZY88_00810 [SAR202 cluster bacterium Io17-Chloro-G9]|nr:MAG: hypothetical protein BZY88_00810 [SAR202 cluster bacterium Io17-Chloro-G9]
MAIVVVAGILTGLVILLALYGLISYIIASSVTKVDRKEQEDHPSAYGLDFEDVEFVSRRGDIALRGWYISGQDDKPALIFVHGIGSVRSGDRAVDLASRLAGIGFNMLMFDLRGHGSSGGDQVSGGYFEQWDVLGAIDFLAGREIPPEKIGLVGFSMGAATAILAAAQEPGIGAVVADSPYAKASDLIAHEAARKTVFPGWLTPIFVPTSVLIADWFYGIDLGSVVPEAAVAELSYPILVIHGTADSRIPYQQGQRVQQSALAGSSIWLAPDVDHVHAFLTYPEEYVERVTVYLEERFGTQ